MIENSACRRFKGKKNRKAIINSLRFNQSLPWCLFLKANINEAENEHTCPTSWKLGQRKLFAAVINEYIHHTPSQKQPPTAKSEGLRTFSPLVIFHSAHLFNSLLCVRNCATLKMKSMWSQPWGIYNVFLESCQKRGLTILEVSHAHPTSNIFR